LERNTVFKNLWVEVIQDKAVNLQNGKTCDYGMVLNRPAVSVLPIDKNGYIYLVKEFKYALNKVLTLSMGGFIEDNEEPLDAAKRELREELGITANKFTECGEMVFFGSISDAKYTLYIAENLEFGKNDLDDNESIEVIRISLEEAYMKVLNNEIIYAPAIALILKVYNLKK